MALEGSELIQQALEETRGLPPRPLRLRTMGESPGLWTRLLLVAAFVLFFAGFLVYEEVIPVMAFYWGTPTQANVVSLWVTHGKGASNNVRVEYFDGTKGITAQISITFQAYQQLSLGERVNIHFSPFFPYKPSLDISPPNFFQFMVLLIWLIFLAGSFASARNAKWLLANGKVLKGYVQELVSRRMNVGFESEGKEYFTWALASNYGGKNQKDDEVVVLCDPDNPQKSRVYDPSQSLWIPYKE